MLRVPKFVHVQINAMKIGILTQSLRNNYGGLLQNYALQTALRHLGHEVCTLDWDWADRNPYKTYIRTLLYFLLRKDSPQKYIPTPCEDEIIHQHVYHFRDTFIQSTNKFKTSKEFISYEQKNMPDAYIVGSDQCWRPKYNPFLGKMFLDFVPKRDVKRIAYAASFGTDSWEFSDTRYSKLIQSFDLVTVREKTGVNLCREHFGIKAHNVLDPTMLLNKEDYIKLIKDEDGGSSSQGDLFYYILDPNQKIKEFIDYAGQKYGMTPFMVLPKYKEEYRTKEHVKDHINECIYPSPVMWLKGIMDAKLTIVDSFHGMVFSIIFNKPFWVICNTSRGISRFTSLLEQIGLEDRILDINDTSKINLLEPIEWSRINKILAGKKKESMELLSNALENG